MTSRLQSQNNAAMIASGGSNHPQASTIRPLPKATVTGGIKSGVKTIEPGDKIWKRAIIKGKATNQIARLTSVSLPIPAPDPS